MKKCLERIAIAVVLTLAILLDFRAQAILQKNPAGRTYTVTTGDQLDDAPL